MSIKSKTSLASLTLTTDLYFVFFLLSPFIMFLLSLPLCLLARVDLLVGLGHRVKRRRRRSDWCFAAAPHALADLAPRRQPSLVRGPCGRVGGVVARARLAAQRHLAPSLDASLWPAAEGRSSAAGAGVRAEAWPAGALFAGAARPATGTEAAV